MTVGYIYYTDTEVRNITNQTDRLKADLHNQSFCSDYSSNYNLLLTVLKIEGFSLNFFAML